MSKNTIMILGANSLQMPLINKANEMGYDTLVISPVEDEPGHKVAKYSEYIDVVNEKKILEIAKKYDICGVITDQTDLPVRTVAYVAEQMKLSGIGYDAACLFTDKLQMREKCKELGIPTLAYKKCSSLEEVQIFYNNLEGKSIILKPVDNQGSKGISKVEKKEELETKFEDAISYSRSGVVLAEEFIDGIEFVVEGMTYDYEFQNLICGDTHYFDIPDTFSATMREFPSCRDESLVKRIVEMNKKIIEGFGLKQGISHSEFIMNGDEIILIECAARGGGVFISSDLINLGAGLETEKFLIEIATNSLKEIPNIEKKSKSCCYLAFYLPENGTIISRSGVEKVLSCSYVHRNNLDSIKVGDKTKEIKDKTARFFMTLEAENHDDLMQKITCVKETIQIIVKTEQGDKGIIWE